MVDPWYEKKFGCKLPELYKLLDTANLKDQKVIADTIAFIETYLENEDEYESIENESLRTKIKFEQALYAEIGSVHNIIAENAMKDYEDVGKYRYPKVSIKDKELLELINSFFSSALDQELYDLFRRMFDNRRELVSLHSMDYDMTIGESLFLPYYKSVYIRLKRFQDVKDPANLAHEYGHGIQFLNNYHPNFYWGASIFSETVSLFFEILMSDYLKTVSAFKSSVPMLQFRALNLTLLSSNRIIVERNMLSSIYRVDKMPERVLRRQIDAEIAKYPNLFGNCSVEDLFNSIVANDSKYVIGFVLALEIFMVYVKDREAGLNLLKRFMDINLNQSQEKYYKKVLSLGIKPNESIDEYKNYISKPDSSIFQKK